MGRRPPAPRFGAGGLPAACGDAQVRAGAAPRRGEGKGRQEEEEEGEGAARKVAQEARFPRKRQGRAGSDGGETAAGTGGVASGALCTPLGCIALPFVVKLGEELVKCSSEEGQ